MDLIWFMERRLTEFEKRGDRERAHKMKLIIREYKAMLDQEQTSIPYL